jgi:hypothetical protein
MCVKQKFTKATKFEARHQDPIYINDNNILLQIIGVESGRSLVDFLTKWFILRQRARSNL